jgi:enoyl-CoA hydratase
VNVKKIGPLTCISINRPEKKNSLTYEVVELLHEAITSLENDPSSNAGVLYGEMGNFCYGYDVEDMTNNPEMITQIESLVG